MLTLDYHTKILFAKPGNIKIKLNKDENANALYHRIR